MRANIARLQILCFAILLAGILLTTLGWAAEKVNPENFELRGTILTKEGAVIVIDDLSFYYSGGTIFYSENGTVIGSGYFAKGMAVGYELEDTAGRTRNIIRIGKIKSVR